MDAGRREALAGMAETRWCNEIRQFADSWWCQLAKKLVLLKIAGKSLRAAGNMCSLMVRIIRSAGCSALPHPKSRVDILPGKSPSSGNGKQELSCMLICTLVAANYR